MTAFSWTLRLFPRVTQQPLTFPAFSTDATSPAALIGSFVIQRQLSIGHDWAEDAQSGAHTALRFSYRLVCQENYYGDTCSRICSPRDDHFGHYACRAGGERACLPGWKGDYCDERKEP